MVLWEAQRLVFACLDWHAISNPERLARYPFYFAALGKFELQSGKYKNAHEHFLAALALARNPMERHFLEQRVSACELPSPQRLS